jgi:hypothetical protein
MVLLEPGDSGAVRKNDRDDGDPAATAGDAPSSTIVAMAIDATIAPRRRLTREWSPPPLNAAPRPGGIGCFLTRAPSYGPRGTCADSVAGS